MKQNKAILGPYIIGITGTIGSGKSTVSRILKEDGAYVIDADVIAREILMPGTKATSKIRKVFGDEVMPDGKNAVDRQKLAKRVFSDKAELEKLNAITLPIIKAEMLARAEAARGEQSIVAFDAPLLIEAGLHEYSNSVWLITASNDVRIERIMARDSTDRQSAEARIKARVSDEELAKYADAVIDNSGSIDELRKKVSALLQNSRG